MKETSEQLEDKVQFLKQYLIDGDIDSFRRHFLSLHTYDQGQFYLSLLEEDRKRLYNFLSPEEMADLFDTIEEDEEFIEDYLQEMNIQYAADMLGEMYTDNAVDILNQLNQEQQKEYLDLMPLDEAEEISDLLVYEDNTAGSIMTTEFVSISAEQTIKEALAEVKQQAEEAETIYYLYVTNAKRQLVGVLSLRDLLTRRDDELVGNVMGTRLISVAVTDDQEEVAHAIRDYDFLAVPVIDLVDRLVGIITVDDIIDVIDEEATSDYSGLAGVDVDEKSENPFVVASKRLPWLVTLLFLGMGTSTLISNYEVMVSEASILAVFISLITGTAGNAGTQSLAVAVRRLAEKEDRQNKVGRMILNELSSGLITGLITGLTVFLLIGIWQSNFVLGLVIGVAMLFAITMANLAGSLIPVLMDKIGFDPAVASGPFITTLSDLTSVFIYFNIAAYFLNVL